MRQLRLIFVDYEITGSLQAFSNHDKLEGGNDGEIEEFNICPPHLEELVVIADDRVLFPDESQKHDLCVNFRRLLDRFCSDGFGLEPHLVIPTLIVTPWLLDGDLGWYEKRAGKLVLQTTDLIDLPCRYLGY